MALVQSILKPYKMLIPYRNFSKIEKFTPGNSASINTSDTLELNNSGIIQGFKIDNQGSTNACGTTSLAAVLRYYGYSVKDHWEIDKTIRSTRFDFFTTPHGIIDYANSKGLRTGLKLNSNLKDLANMIDQGVPVMVLTDSTPENKTDFYLHWQVVTGYKKDRTGNIDKLIIADPSSGSVDETDANEFLKEWSNIKLGPGIELPLVGQISVNTGYDRMFIAMVPPNRLIKTPSGKVINSNSITLPKNFDTVHGFLAHGVSKIAKFGDDAIGVAESVGNAINDGASYVGNKLKSAAKSIYNLF